MPSTVTIALDVMSGDKGSAPAISGALKSLKDNKDLKIDLIGDKLLINETLVTAEKSILDRIDIIHTDEFIKMNDDVISSIRSKKKSSMRLCINSVKDKKADACVSEGNTGALM